MKNQLIIFILSLVFANLNAQSLIMNEMVSLGPGYQNQSFYSFSSGETGNVNNENWDLCFSTGSMSYAIRINDGKGVELYNYTLGDTSAWSAISPASTGSLGNPIFNSDTSWSKGAFNKYEDGNFDLGWGMYSMITHHVVGDSLFIVKTVNGNWKKLWIEELASGQYTFRHANLDGSNLVSQSINKNNYPNKSFIYYSIDNNQIEDREPSSTDWDITFTKYITPVQGQPYSVTGVLANQGIDVAKADNINSPNTYTNYISHPFLSAINTIGYDWKTFDMSSFSYFLEDDLCYFVRDISQNIWRIVFTNFYGSSSGDIEFNKELMSSSTNTLNSNNEILFMIYPNPAKDKISLVYDNLGISILTIVDVSGKIVYQQEFNNNNFSSQNIDVSFLESGVYITQLKHKDIVKTQQLIIK